MAFNKHDLVIAKKEFLASYEKESDTIGIVTDYDPTNDSMYVGVLNPQDYAFPPQFHTRGEYYRLLTEEEKALYNI